MADTFVKKNCDKKMALHPYVGNAGKNEKKDEVRKAKREEEGLTTLKKRKKQQLKVKESQRRSPTDRLGKVDAGKLNVYSSWEGRHRCETVEKKKKGGGGDI